ncbi:hypothetical protein [Pedobacter frigoris]|uniref:Uncharacterized protein n=1 Tax=Pedobacter frigoris TaxID=2571272 RepID=A0A4U1CC94_9SPHI|nr:hypothetical protein [Pedobacter frigoris]TKC04355.1 hypothetical protein FA047_17375 [Pedobacter frigoris]
METKEILARIELAMDKVIEEYQNDNFIIFSDHNDKQKFLFDKDYFKSLRFGKTNTCMFLGCVQRAINNSHTIQKATSISTISEDGHLLWPTFNHKKGVLELSKIGLNYASTFPGFCRAHEQMFNPFEEKKDMSTEQDFRLQVYRSICREIVENKRSLDTSLLRRNQYILFRDNKLSEMIRAEADALHIDSKSIVSMRHEFVDWRLRELNKSVKQSEAYLADLHKLYLSIHNDLVKNKAQKVFVQAMEVDWVIPCCLAGRGGFKLNNKSKRRADIILNALPYENKTFLILASHFKDKRFVDTYINSFTKHPFHLIKMVESWMLYGSDHWFIRPSVWESLADDVKDKVLKELFNFNKSIYAVADFEIFVGLREQLILRQQT